MSLINILLTQALALIADADWELYELAVEQVKLFVQQDAYSVYAGNDSRELMRRLVVHDVLDHVVAIALLGEHEAQLRFELGNHPVNDRRESMAEACGELVMGREPYASWLEPEDVQMLELASVHCADKLALWGKLRAQILAL